MRYSKELLELTKDKKFSLIELNENNSNTIEDIVTPREFIVKNEISGKYNYHVALKVKNFIGRCCYSHTGSNTIYVNQWPAVKSPCFDMKSIIRSRIGDVGFTYYFLFISENESDHVKLKLAM